MRLIDADELLINVWRDKPDDTVSIAKMINNAPTVKDIPTKEDAEPIVDLDSTRIFMIGILLGYDQKHDEMDKFKEDIKRIFEPKPNTDLIDKIKAEIESLKPCQGCFYDGITRCLEIIDKHRASFLERGKDE